MSHQRSPKDDEILGILKKKKLGFPQRLGVKNLPAMLETQETWVLSPGREDSLEKEIATHSINRAWEILRTEKPGRL